MLVIVAGADDDHAVAVAKRVPSRIVDLAALPAAGLTLRVTGGQVGGHVAGLDTADLDRVWLRRVNHPTGVGLPPDEARLAAWETHAAVAGLAAARPDTWWVNDPVTIGWDGGNGKLAQLAAAQRVGLATPPTLVTTDPATARAFVDTHGEVVAKPFRCPHGQLLWARLVDSDALPHLDLLRAAPAILQRREPKVGDVRVVVTGRATMATLIRSQVHADSALDFRRRCGELPHEAHTLPAQVAEGLVATVRASGLKMGAADLILRPDGAYVFLEVNPQGQWLWLQRTGQDYVGRVAAFLASRDTDFTG